MKPDVLFWFYKEFAVCKAHINLLKKNNPDSRVYALYGGSLEQENEARHMLEAVVDDFYTYPYEHEPRWKWLHGEQLIETWYKERGKQLEWESVFIMQWDMLVADRLDNIFSSLNAGEILLSGFRPLEEIQSWWPWGKPDNPELIEFKHYLQQHFNYQQALYACLFIIVCLPRIFLEKYAQANVPINGFLEYKMPSLAKVFDVPICTQHSFNPWWAADPNTQQAPPEAKTLNAVLNQVPTSVILKELAKPQGHRIFHPVFNPLPVWLLNCKAAHHLGFVFELIEKLKHYIQPPQKLKRF